MSRAVQRVVLRYNENRVLERLYKHLHFTLGLVLLTADDWFLLYCAQGKEPMKCNIGVT